MGITLGFKTCMSSLFVVMCLLSVHYVTLHLYTTVCIPFGVKGYIFSLFTVGSPPCFFLFKIASALHETYVTFWITMGIAVISFGGDVFDRFKQSFLSK
jgi:hypothetical protein